MKHFTAFLLIFSINILIVNSQWIEQQSGVTSPLNAVHISQNNSNKVWVCGDNGIVLLTTNGGTNWVNVSSNLPATYNFTSIIEVNFINTMVAGKNVSGNSAVYRSTNSGQSWSLVHSQNSVQYYGFANSYSTILVGSPLNGRWQLWRSTNFGSNWDSAGFRLFQSGSETGFNNAVWAVDNSLWIGTNNSKIYYSPTLGGNWQSQSTGAETDSRAVVFAFVLTDAIAYGFTGGTNGFKSSNQGSSWVSVNTPGSGVITGAACGGGQTTSFWYTKGPNIYAGQNGDIFSLQYAAPSGNYRHIYANFINTSPAWAVRDNGGISKFTGQIGINVISSEIPENFSLSQNYPNPFNPSTVIRFSIPSKPLSFGEGLGVGLYVYNSLGQKIAVLVNQSLSPGTYSVEWDASNYPSGLYFYTLTYGDFSDTKKMILLK